MAAQARGYAKAARTLEEDNEKERARELYLKSAKLYNEASKLSNDYKSGIRENPEGFKEALKIIEKVTLEYSKACLETGVEGIFFASQEYQQNRHNDDTIMDR